MYNVDYIKEILSRFLNEYCEQEAFAIYDGEKIRQISFTDFAADILTVMGFFQENGIRREHIALAAPNSYEWLVVYWSILASGNVAVLINPALPKEEMKRQCDFTDVSYIFSDNSIVNLQCRDSNAPQLLLWNKLCEATPALIETVEQREADELVCLLFTSGTAGTSKAVMMTAENMEACISGLVNGAEKLLLTMPLYHISGLGSSLWVLTRGKTICIGRGVKYLFKDMAYLNPVYVPLVPGMMDSLVKLLKRFPDREERKRYMGDKLQRISIGGAAPMAEACRYLIEQGFTLCIGHGLTETMGCGTWGMLTMDNLKTIGAPMKSVRYRIENNEILISGKCVTAGYYKDPEATQRVIKDGWLYTGDLGYRDENGNYYLTGRKKNVIILSNGENVSPEEIEYELGRYNEILECMVYGMPKGIYADVYTENEKDAALQIKEYNRKVPTYRQIIKVNYYDTPLEKTGSEKIKRKTDA